MYKVLVGGNIGSGKSCVVERMKELGALVISLDGIAHMLLADDEQMRAELVDAFGSGILADDGTIDHVQLAHRAFGDAISTGSLDSITHPRIMQRAVSAIDQAECGCLPCDAAVLVIEVPLLVGADDLCALADEVIVVTAPSGSRIDRLLERGLDEDDITNRMARQPSDGQLEARATKTVVNDGTREDLWDKVDLWWSAHDVDGWVSNHGA